MVSIELNYKLTVLLIIQTHWHVFLMAVTEVQEAVKVSKSLKVSSRTAHTVTSAHTPLTTVSHMAKPDVSGLGKYSLPLVGSPAGTQHMGQVEGW